MMKRGDMIGGAFGSEPESTGVNFPLSENSNCVWLNSGRAALECILLSMPRRPKRAFVPRFTCDTVLQPFRRLGIPTLRYEIEEDDLLLLQKARLPGDAGEDDLLLLTNYFGFIPTEALRAAAERHPGPSVVDAATALFAESIPELPTFYSLRKFAGVPDGGAATAPFPLRLPREQDDSRHRLTALRRRDPDGAVASLPAFEEIEKELSLSPPLRMSPQTRGMIARIDWMRIAGKRRENYRHLHAKLRCINRLNLPPDPPSAPFCYPLLCGIPNLRDELIDAGLALPLYWSEVIEATDAADPANKLARTLLPIPLDQRYDAQDILTRLGKIL